MEGGVQMEDQVIRGRGVIPGRVEGEALVCPSSITGWGGIDPATGVIKEFDNPNRGETIKDKLLVLPGSKGSNGWSCYFSITRTSGASPRGMLITAIDASCAVAAVGLSVPTIVDFPAGSDPCSVIRSGDSVVMDGETGVVTITHRA
jgi:predicted aconitase with swiveling domain